MKITSLNTLPPGGFVNGLLPVYYNGEAYKAAVSDISGGVTSAVSPQQFGGDPTGIIPANSAVLQAFATGRPVLIDGWYRLTSTITTPANSVCYLANYDCGFVADMATGPSIQWGDNSFIPSLRVKSNAYPASALANNNNWALQNRAVLPGNNCRFGSVWVEDITTGIDCTNVSNVHVDYLHARNIRNKDGQAAAWHTHSAYDCWLNYLDAKNCDRGSEIEFASQRCGVMQFRLESIYPAGYVGQPVGYATYSFVISVHSHAGEGGCRDIIYGDGWISDCLGAIQVQCTTAVLETDYPQGVRIGDVVINNPRNNRVPIESMSGIDVQIKSLRFTGVPFTSDLPLIEYGIANTDSFTRNIEITRLTVDDGAFIGRLLTVDAPDCVIRNLDIGPQGGTSTTPPILIRSRGTRFMINRAMFRSAKYSSSLYTVSGAPVGIRRMYTSYSLDNTNPIASTTSAAWIALPNKYEVNNTDF